MKCAGVSLSSYGFFHTLSSIAASIALPFRDPKRATIYLIGLTGGLAGGLLGIGGGSAIAPLLLLTGSLRPAQVSGTTLATVLFISIVGSVTYATLGHIDLGLVWPIAIGSISGAVLGALAARRLSIRLMIGLFLVVIPYFVLKEVWPSVAAPALSTSFVSLIAMGSVTGFLSGLLGISGASLIVPSLVGFFLIDHHAAQGIAMTVALADSAAGTATHARSGNINWRMLLYLAIPAVMASVGGAILSDHLSASALRYMFAVFMVAVWATLLARLAKDWLRGKVLSRGSAALGVPSLVVPATGTLEMVDRQAQNPVPWIMSSGFRWFSGGTAKSLRTLMAAMLVFVPLAVLGEVQGYAPTFVFGCAALSCISLSYWLGQATESLGSRLGPVAGGLLNATFGNAAEVVISVLALSHGLYIVVRTGLVGSILGQLLLVLGTSLLVAGLKHRKLGFSQPSVQVNFILMVLALVAIGLPNITTYFAEEEGGRGLSLLPILLPVMLITIYILAVVFSLGRQPQEDLQDGGRLWSIPVALTVLVTATAGIVMVSELLVGSILPFVESTGISQVFIGLILIPIFGNVVDHMVAISVALKNRMDLSLTISVGSAAQVACLVIPMLILISFARGRSAALVFTPVELVALAAGVFLMVPVLLDGESNWLEGAELLTCYLIVATVLWSI